MNIKTIIINDIKVKFYDLTKINNYYYGYQVLPNGKISKRVTRLTRKEVEKA